MGALKKVRTKIYAFVAPKWCTKVLVTKQEMLDALEFWDHFEVPMHPTLARMRRIISKKNYGDLSLKHQKIMVRCILADIAMKGCAAWKDSLFNEISAECADHLAQANRADVLKNIARKS